MPTVDVLRQIAVAFIPPRYLRTPLAASGCGFANDVAWQSRLASEFCVAPDVIIVEGFGHIRHRRVCPAPDHVHSGGNVFQRAGNLAHTFGREGRLLWCKPYAVGFVKHPLDGGKRFVGIGVLVAQQPLADLCPFAGGMRSMYPLNVSPRVTLEQLEEYFNSENRIHLAAQFVLASIPNLRLVIRYYNKMYPETLYDSMLRKIDRVAKKIINTRDYDELLLLEAQARQFYYRCFDSFIRVEGFVFEKRSRRPPLNEVNAMLSFGNTLLYSLLANEINKTPLDVRIGFLHATNRREQSLNLDLAEIFKPLLVDRVVFSLINRRAIKPDDFYYDGKGIYLNAKGKQLFLNAFYEKLDTGVTVKGKSVKYKSIIKEEIQKLVRHFRQGERYKPFKQIR